MSENIIDAKELHGVVPTPEPKVAELTDVEEELAIEYLKETDDKTDVETLNDEQDIIDNEEDIRRLNKQIKTRKIAAGVFFALSAICLVARLIAL